jgi:hypothetical protein
MKQQRTRRVGCVARRIIEKLDNSFDEVSIEQLAVYVYGDSGWRSIAHIRGAIGRMTLPEGWAQHPGDAGVSGLERCLPPEIFKARARRWQRGRNRISKKTLIGA